MQETCCLSTGEQYYDYYSINVIFNGFGKIVQGVLERRYSVSVRVFLISLGILSLDVAILVGHAEQFGMIFLTRILSLGDANGFFRNYGEVSIAKNFEKIVCN
jgi:hypothetical protein